MFMVNIATRCKYVYKMFTSSIAILLMGGVHIDPLVYFVSEINGIQNHMLTLVTHSLRRSHWLQRQKQRLHCAPCPVWLG